ncbi:MAG: TetR/AcrR family transcriptional regulator [Kordiimonadaceae bacterium]|jgi:AcrR family transcriptional regulator|nr:TetR/AcrR family transcriptional regulator [Kordiimonadaceae bacterium]MBT6031415.1 TetR/AcrR family transcriptional regulator [Kordiimonadaceae bacterium]
MNTRKSTYHHGNLREVLITSALEILKEGTIQDLSLRALARKAGVSQTAPYRHFEDKEALIVVLILEGSAIMQEYMKNAIAISDDPVERLINLGISYCDFSQDHPAHFRLMFSGNVEDKEKYEALVEADKNGSEIVEVIVSECMKLPNAPQIKPEIVRLACWSLVHGLANLILNDVIRDDILIKRDKRTVVSEVISFYTKTMFEK